VALSFSCRGYVLPFAQPYPGWPCRGGGAAALNKPSICRGHVTSEAAHGRWTAPSSADAHRNSPLPVHSFRKSITNIARGGGYVAQHFRLMILVPHIGSGPFVPVPAAKDFDDIPSLEYGGRKCPLVAKASPRTTSARSAADRTRCWPEWQCPQTCIGFRTSILRQRRARQVHRPGDGGNSL
jgi:hypothetical protein